MISFKGKWQNGRTSDQQDVSCRVYDNGSVRVERLADNATVMALPRFDITASPRLANTARYLYFPDGHQIETEDNDTVDRVLEQFNQKSWLALVHRLENRWAYVIIAIGLFLFLFGASVKYGIPFASKAIAFKLPPSVQRAAENQTVKAMDKSFFEASQLGIETRTRLMNHFHTAIANHAELTIRIEFRKGGHLGPNAFALPAGTIIFTDEMVLLSENDDELLAVLAHEIGHIVHRHGLRTLVQDSLLGFLLLAITGDVTGSSELFLGFPVLLTELAYSRAFEREADQYALAYLRSNSIPPTHFAHLMRRIHEKMAAQSNVSENKWINYLSTHPMTEDRLRIFEEPH